MKTILDPGRNPARETWKRLVAYLALLSIMAGSAHAFPGSSADCASCHASSGGALEIFPQMLRISPGGEGGFVFDVPSLPDGGRAALALIGLGASGLKATPDLTGWRERNGGSWLTSDVFTTIGAVPLDLTIDAAAMPGSYPLEVALAGAGGWSTTLAFSIVVVHLEDFRRGDCNDDGTIDISDAIFTLGSLFLGDSDPHCDDACDSNDDGELDISDVVTTVSVLFLGQGVIPPPGMTDCGVDPTTEDALGCETAPAGCQ